MINVFQDTSTTYNTSTQPGRPPRVGKWVVAYGLWGGTRCWSLPQQQQLQLQQQQQQIGNSLLVFATEVDIRFIGKVIVTQDHRVTAACRYVPAR